MHAFARMIISLALLAVCMPAAAQTAPPAKAATGSITGHITVGSKGVAYATVTLYHLGQAVTKATTDQDGRYTFTSVAPGQYTIRSSARAYVSAGAQDVARAQKEIEVDEGESVDNLDFPLVRGGVIAGRVTGPKGKPLIGERMYLISAEGYDVLGPLDLSAQGPFTTDDRGIFRVFGLPAGRYVVAIGEVDNQGRSGRRDARAHYRRTYHPEATEQSQAKDVEVTEGGEVTGIDITVGRVMRKYTASGRVIDEATGKPMTNVSITAEPVMADPHQYPVRGPATRPDGQGNFRLEDLLPGRYLAFTEGGEREQAEVPFEITDKDVSGLELKLKRGASVNGVAVLTGTDNPQAAAQLGKLKLYAFTSEFPQAYPRSTFNIPINPDGSFRMAGVSAGYLHFKLEPGSINNGFSILQVERDGVPQAQGIAITQGEPNVNIKVVIGYGSGTVRGQFKIINGQLPPGALVGASIQHPGRTVPDPLQHTMVDERGRFTFDKLASGPYDVVVYAFIRGPEGSGAKWVKTVTEKVTVTSGAEAQVTVTLDLGPDKKEDRQRLKIGER